VSSAPPFLQPGVADPSPGDWRARPPIWATASLSRLLRKLLGTQAPAEQKQPWTISCQENASGTVSNCQLAQHVVIRDTGKRLLSVMVEQRPTQTGLSLLILMSHGVFLPAGIALQAPGMEQIELEYRLSDAEGVYAATTLTDDLLKALQSAETLKISVVSAGRQRIGIPVSLKGFGAAFGKLTGTQ